MSRAHIFELHQVVHFFMPTDSFPLAAIRFSSSGGVATIQILNDLLKRSHDEQKDGNAFIIFAESIITNADATSISCLSQMSSVGRPV